MYGLIFIILPIFVFLILEASTKSASNILSKIVVELIFPLSLFVFYMCKSKFSIRKFAQINLYLGVVAAFIVIINVVIFNTQGRISLYGDSPIWTARLLMLSVLSYMLSKKNLLNMIMVLFLFVATLFTGSRTPVIAAIICFITFALIQRSKVKSEKRKKHYGSLIAMVILYLLMIILILVFLSNLNNSSINRFVSIGNQGINDQTSSGRFSIWMYYLEKINMNNIFLGQLRLSDQPTDLWDIIYPHNIFIELLYKIGLVGLLYYTILIFIPIFKFIKVYKESNKEIDYVFCIYIFYFINANFSGNIFANLNVAVFGYLVILMIKNNVSYLSWRNYSSLKK
jgi:O-antigen ligase